MDIFLVKMHVTLAIYYYVETTCIYIKGTLHYGLQLHRTLVTDLVAYSDADWVGCIDTRQSTSGYGVFFGDNLVFRSSKHQHNVSRSSTETEYHAVVNALTETCYLHQLLHELHQPVQRAILVHCDNVSAVYLMTNLVWHQLLSILRLPFTLFETRLCLVRFKCYMCSPPPSMLTFSLKVSTLQCL
jgi:hypothetical protein